MKLKQHLHDENMTAAELFKYQIFKQKVKSKKKTQELDVMKAEDFFRALYSHGICSEDNEHANLKEFLQLNVKFPDILALKSIERTLKQMTEDEKVGGEVDEVIENASQGS